MVTRVDEEIDRSEKRYAELVASLRLQRRRASSGRLRTQTLETSDITLLLQKVRGHRHWMEAQYRLLSNAEF